ncbi:MAG: hypothetical protein ACRCZQ_10865, partial [Bacteroidales bacterium]
MIERNISIINNKEENDFLSISLRKLIEYWPIAEPKHIDKVKEVIIKLATGEVACNSHQLIELLKQETVERLYRNNGEIPEYANILSDIKEPNILLNSSNAPYHEIKQRVKYYIRE